MVVKVRWLNSSQFVPKTTESPEREPGPELFRNICDHLGREVFMQSGKSVKAYRTRLAPVLNFRK